MPDTWQNYCNQITAHKRGSGCFCSFCGSIGHLQLNPLAEIGPTIFICISCVSQKITARANNNPYKYELEISVNCTRELKTTNNALYYCTCTKCGQPSTKVAIPPINPPICINCRTNNNY